MKEIFFKRLFYSITALFVLLLFSLTSCQEEDKPKDTSFYGTYTNGEYFVDINKDFIEVHLYGNMDSILDRDLFSFTDPHQRLIDYRYTYKNTFFSYDSAEDAAYIKSFIVYPRSGKITAWAYYYAYNQILASSEELGFHLEDLGYGTFNVNDTINSIALNIKKEKRGLQCTLEVQGKVDSLPFNSVLYKYIERNNLEPRNRTNKMQFAKTFDNDNYKISETVLDIIIQKQNHTLVINNNKNTNGGYHFVYYEWYRIDSSGDTLLISNNDLGYYSTGRNDKNLDASSYYYAVLYADDSNLYYTKPFKPSLNK